MESANEVITDATIIPALEIKKERKRSEYRTVYGSKSIRKTSSEVQKIMAEFQSYDEKVSKYIEMGIFKNPAEAVNGNKDGLKLTPPTGVTELYNLKKMIRSAVLRPEIVVDAIKLCQIAEFISERIGENDLLIRREEIVNQEISDKEPK